MSLIYVHDIKQWLSSYNYSKHMNFLYHRQSIFTHFLKPYVQLAAGLGQSTDSPRVWVRRPIPAKPVSFVTCLSVESFRCFSTLSYPINLESCISWLLFLWNCILWTLRNREYQTFVFPLRPTARFNLIPCTCTFYACIPSPRPYRTRRMQFQTNF